MTDATSAGAPHLTVGARLRRYAESFGQFWWEFLIGDTPELFLATLVLIGLAIALHRSRVLAVVLLLVAAVTFLVGSTWRGRRRRLGG